MIKDNTPAQHHNPPDGAPRGIPATRLDPVWGRLAGVIQDDAERFTDLQFREETPDDVAAERWFKQTFWGAIDGIRCPRCAWNERGRLSADSSGLTYWCPRCRKTFSIKIETVMYRSPLTLHQWKQALYIWTGGLLPSSSEEVSRRMGVGDGTARDIVLRILNAAEEDIPPLREPAEMAVFLLAGNPHFRQKGRGSKPGRSSAKRSGVTAIALVGRRTGTTVIRTITKVRKAEIEQFIRKHLAPGMDLYLSDHSANQGVRGAALHLVPEPEASYLLQDLRERIRTAFITVHNWVSDEHMAEYLAGYQWWENHLHLSHRERMEQLARGMRWKDPPPSTSQRKRAKRNPRRPVGDGASASKLGRNTEPIC